MSRIMILGMMIMVCCLCLVPVKSDAVTIHPGVHLHIGNEHYNVSSLTFTHVFLAETYLQANNTQFHITSPNDIYLVLNHLNGTMTGASWDMLLNFTAFTNTDDNVYFNISGFTVDSNYTINRSGLSHRDSTANVSGYINWTNNDWDTSHYFEIYIKEAVAAAVLFLPMFIYLVPTNAEYLLILFVIPFIFLYLRKRKKKRDEDEKVHNSL